MNEEYEPCPDYVFLKRGVDGNLQLEIPAEYQGQFEPITTKQYDQWLKEKSEDPIALKELADCEMEPREEEDKGDI